MGKQTNEFQRLIRRIYVQIAGLRGATVRESVMLVDRASGTNREVDVLVEFAFAGHTHRLAVECRDRKKKDDVQWVDGLIGKYSHLPVNKVVAVSKSGFSEGARQKAANCIIDIELMTLSEATATNWPRNYLSSHPILVHSDNCSIRSLIVRLGVWPLASGKWTMGDTMYNEEGEAQETVAHVIGRLGDPIRRRVAEKVLKDIGTFLRDPRGLDNDLEFTMYAFLRPKSFLRYGSTVHELVSMKLSGICRFTHFEADLQRHMYGSVRIAHGTVQIGSKQEELTMIYEPDAKAPGVYLGDVRLSLKTKQPD